MKNKRKSKSLRVLCLCLSGLMLTPPTGWAQVVKPASVVAGEPEQLLELRWSDAPLDVVLDHYAELTGRTLIRSPGVPAVLISLKSQEKLTESEFMVAIESVLAMNNIALVPMGDKFLKVIPVAELGTHGEQIEMGKPEPGESRNGDVLERRIVELRHVELAEIQPVIDQLKHTYAKIQPLERANSFLISDTKLNLDRIIEIIDFLDKPFTIKAETRIYELQHAEAAQVASRLSELIQESQGSQRTAAGRTATPATRGGVIRAGTTAARVVAAQAAPGAAVQSDMDLAQRGIIQGEVKIVSDERTNILIIISEPPNFAFFDQIVTVLDKAIDPEIAVEVLPLEYADAEEISGILNDFVGAATQESSRSGTRGGSTRGTQSTGDAEADARSTALRDFIARRQAAATAASVAGSADASVAGIGQLSENTRILADARTNSILLMGRRSDIEALRQVVDDLDIMLSQVMIEAIIIEVTLSDGIQSGFDWLQRSYQVYNEERLGPGGGYSVRQPVIGFGGAQQFSGTPFIDGGSVDRDTPVPTGALSYFATFYDLNVDVIMQLIASSSDARILSTPVVVTTDNTEAKIIVGESRPIVTSTSTTAGGVGRNTYQYQDIGIQLTVTPRINPQKFVVMEILQTADNVGGFEVIDGNNVPVITRRELEAQIAVENRSSIVLGGLMASEARKSRTKIPVLGDIPLLGTFFRSDRTDEYRAELLVVITPYVMSTPEEALAESQRLGDRSVVTGENAWRNTWSDSPMIRDRALAEDRAPQPLFDRLLGQGEDELAPPPADLMVARPEPEEEARVIMRPAPTVEYRVVPDPDAERRPIVETPPPETAPEPRPPLSRMDAQPIPVAEVIPPRVDAEAIDALRAGIQDPRAALEAPTPEPAAEPAALAIDATLLEPVPMAAPEVLRSGETEIVESELPAEPGPAPQRRGLFSRLFGREKHESMVSVEPPSADMTEPVANMELPVEADMEEAVVEEAVMVAPTPIPEAERAVPAMVEPEMTEEIAIDRPVDRDIAPSPTAPPGGSAPPALTDAPARVTRMELPGRDAAPVPPAALPEASPPPVASPRETLEEVLPVRQVVRPAEPRRVAPPVRPMAAPEPAVEAPTAPVEPARGQRLAQELESLMPSQDLATQQERTTESEVVVGEETVPSPMPSTPRRMPAMIQGPQPMEVAPPVSGAALDDPEAAPPLK